MKDEFTTDDGWAVAGILTDLQGALLTGSVGDGGLAGSIELGDMLVTAANDAAFGQLEGELG
jgi:hypothetical protein